MKEIILIGGGGHCKSCIDVIEAEGRFKIAGIVDLKEKIGKSVFGYKIIASDEDIPILVKEYKHFLITIGSIGKPDKRVNIFKELKKYGVSLPTIVSPLAYVSKYSSIGEGTIIMHNALVNAGASIGVNSIINSKSIIEHDVRIGNHCHISTNVTINGKTEVGNFSFIGSSAIILNGLKIKERTIIGAGAVVIKDIKEQGTYVGNPARRIK
ncbi:acetyltransferase [Desulfurobacterium crinifex]